MKNIKHQILGLVVWLFLFGLVVNECRSGTAYHGITEILGDVAKFDGKKVLIQGFIYLDENEFISIYKGQEDFRNGNAKEAILISRKGLTEILKAEKISDDEIDQHIADIVGKQWMIEGILRKVENAEDYFVPIVQLETIFRLFRSDLSGRKYSNETEALPDPFR